MWDRFEGHLQWQKLFEQVIFPQQRSCDRYMLKWLMKKFPRLQCGLYPSRKDRFTPFRVDSGDRTTILKLYRFLTCQHILNALDDRIQVVLLVDIVKIVGADGQDRAQVKRT